MTTPTARQFAVLREVARLETSGHQGVDQADPPIPPVPAYSPRVATIAERLRMTDSQVRNIARRLSAPHWDAWAPTDESDPRGHPWLTFNKHHDTAGTTADGKIALANARGALHLPTRSLEWKDESLTGMRPDGDPSTIENAVQQTGGTLPPGRRDPESAALTRHLVEAYGMLPEWAAEFTKTPALFCGRCHLLGRFPFKKRCDFYINRDGSRRPECKQCKLELTTERRSTDGQ